MKSIRKIPYTDYVANQTVSITIGAGGGTDTDTVENVPTTPNAAIEIELDDGTVFVVLGYNRK